MSSTGVLKPHGLWFPVDVSTASRATIGGMAGNNSCGGRSLRYGTMRDNVVSIDAVLADGERMHFGPVAAGSAQAGADAKDAELIGRLLAIGEREADEVAARFPKVQRRVGGYNLDALLPNAASHNFAHILVGSEGTLAYSTAIELKLWPVLGKRALGVCHFGSFHEAMDAAQHLVRLKPIAIELVDATMITLASSIAMFRPTLEAFLRGEPEALLVVEFAESEAENRPAIEGASRAHGRSRLRLGSRAPKMGGRGRCSRPGFAKRHRRSSHLRPQHHDVDEERGKARLLRRGLRRASCRSSPNTRKSSPRFSPSTARAAPGMRMRPKVACMCARSSTSSSRRM